MTVKKDKTHCGVCGSDDIYRGKRQWVCRPCYSRYSRKSYNKHKLARRDTRLQKTYGLTQEQFDAIVESQGGGCLLCGERPGGRYGQLVVDHDHNCCPSKTKTCGKCVRGILCDWCNRMLGLARESPELLHAAAKYVASPAHLVILT